MSDSHALSQIRDRLPGGEGVQLPSFEYTEYSMFGRNSNNALIGPDDMRRPYKLMKGGVPHPMTPLNSADTFSSVKEAVVELAYSAYTADMESRVSLRLWTRGHHEATVFKSAAFRFLQSTSGTSRDWAASTTR